MAALIDKFAFDVGNLLGFCKRANYHEAAKHSESFLELKVRDLENCWEKVGKSYEKLMLSDADEQYKTDAQSQYEESSEFYYKTVSKLLDVSRPLKESVDAQEVRNITQRENYNTYLKLPPCDTQVFSGSYEEWPAFRDMFTAVYINHPQLTNAEKLYHLRNKTTNAASAIVNRFALTDENFNLAWQALKTRYENVRVLVDNQIRNLFNIPAADIEDSESLQRIHSSVTDCLSVLKTLGVSSEGWDPMINYLVYSKLPHETLSQWEQSLNASRDLPKWSELSKFLETRCEIVERLSTIGILKNPRPTHDRPKTQIQTYASLEKLHTSCKMCDEDHSLRICPKFRKLSIQERVDFIFKNQYCNNCLSAAHTKTKCKSRHTCLNCGKMHHTLLHMTPSNLSKKNLDQLQHKATPNVKNNSSTLVEKAPVEDHMQPETSHAAKLRYLQTFSNHATSDTKILLRTAVVQIKSRGELFNVRALIDPGSERTFLSEKIRNRLGLLYRKSYFNITGVGGQSQVADKECDLTLTNIKSDFNIKITAIVLPRVTNKIPSSTFKVKNYSKLTELDLADPSFNIASPVDLILGNDCERYINLEGIKRNVYGLASAYKTVFGWVLSGPVQNQQIASFSSLVVRPEAKNMEVLLRKFWEQEEIPTTPPVSPDNTICEEFYRKTTERIPDGRYMVRLPFRTDFPEQKFLGPSRFVALSQYVRLGQTLSKNTELEKLYNDVLGEYLTLDHMEETTSCEYFADNKCNSFYLPHHAVARPDSKTTKLRVVFNASRKSKSGFSLNDVLYTGPTLQADLTSVILNWRLYKYVFSGDIEKMYRQILVHPNDRPFQRILFQKSPQDPVKDYQLKTVTFGVNCAPYLAIRTLLQLAQDNQDRFPLASNALQRETYVDDILTGGHSIEGAISCRIQLMQSLATAGFTLKKFTAKS